MNAGPTVGVGFAGVTVAVGVGVTVTLGVGVCAWHVKELTQKTSAKILIGSFRFIINESSIKLVARSARVFLAFFIDPSCASILTLAIFVKEN